ncbi:MAG TPA: ribose-5-phosphate isomerase RpiA [Acidobacteriaceae bacterium]|nr:ribose-5-phosphate isomerase RpiA [Acidobacteriaceae bacterium]
MPPSADRSEQDRLKLEAAQRALQFVEPGMAVGLGSGSTATVWIRLLGERVRDHGLKIRAVASSQDSEHLGRSFGIPIVTFDQCSRLDLTVDGADEIAPGLALIKGGGGKLLREKIVASATERFVVVADESKIVEKLGKGPLPVEVIPMAAPLVRRSLLQLGFEVVERRNSDGSPYVTDEGNLLLDCSGIVIDDPEKLAATLDDTVGVVEHGLFLNFARLAIVATENGIVERTA